MAQIYLNLFFIFVLPPLVGILLRLLLKRQRYAWALTALWAGASLLLFLWASTNPLPVSEGPGLYAIQAAGLTAGALVAGLICHFRKP